MRRSRSGPSIHSAYQLIRDGDTNTACVGGVWVPARPIGAPTIFGRIRAAWLVFTGRADAVVWHGQGDR